MVSQAARRRNYCPTETGIGLRKELTMANEQLEMWPEEIPRGYRLNQHLLAPGEKPDTRPWGGIFSRCLEGNPAASPTAVQSKNA